MKRFYRTVSLVPEAGGVSVHLDGRPLRTPARKLLQLPTREAAAAIAQEWSEAGDEIDLQLMRLTRLANSAIDRVASDRISVLNDMMRYAETDLVCYRCDSPAELRQRQDHAWSPLVEWIYRRYGVELQVVTGILPRAQLPETLRRMEAVVDGYGDFSLTGLHAAATASGSMVIALALAGGELDAATAWGAALVDELWQVEAWGVDEEAEQRRQGLMADIHAAASLLSLCDGA